MLKFVKTKCTNTRNNNHAAVDWRVIQMMRTKNEGDNGEKQILVFD
jgi:hypothetical protein